MQGIDQQYQTSDPTSIAAIVNPVFLPSISLRMARLKGEQRASSAVMHAFACTLWLFDLQTLRHSDLPDLQKPPLSPQDGIISVMGSGLWSSLYTCISYSLKQLIHLFFNCSVNNSIFRDFQKKRKKKIFEGWSGQISPSPEAHNAYLLLLLVLLVWFGLVWFYPEGLHQYSWFYRTGCGIKPQSKTSQLWAAFLPVC